MANSKNSGGTYWNEPVSGPVNVHEGDVCFLIGSATGSEEQRERSEVDGGFDDLEDLPGPMDLDIDTKSETVTESWADSMDGIDIHPSNFQGNIDEMDIGAFEDRETAGGRQGVKVIDGISQERILGEASGVGGSAVGILEIEITSPDVENLVKFDERVQHIIRQGVYRYEEIAVLTPYTEQERNLKETLGKGNAFSDANDQRSIPKKSNVIPDHQGIRISTIDSFQGEEAKIIIISLARSNNTGNVGYLSFVTAANVNNRAQHGLFIIGNTKIAECVPMWSEVIKVLRLTSFVGTIMSLRCPRHPDVRMEVSQPEDFDVISPEGGCTAICNK
ncbi:AAA domain-containing protein [Bisporella sp. PMI_857]|nr:AAA domain-containing protein [Bisporella sp. PMI_857]